MTLGIKNFNSPLGIFRWDVLPALTYLLVVLPTLNGAGSVNVIYQKKTAECHSEYIKGYSKVHTKPS